MRSEPVNGDDCGLSRRWLLDPTLAHMLVSVEAEAERIFSAQGIRWPGLYVISGFRTQAEQVEVNPDFPNSLHRRCPALAVDLRVGDLPASTTENFWPFIARLWRERGGSWGGLNDPNHFSTPAVGDRGDPGLPERNN